MIRLSIDKTYLVDDHGVPFFYLADTWWFGITKRLSDQNFKRLLLLRKKQGFTAIQIVLGIPPEITVKSEQAENEGGHPFFFNHGNTSINPLYFDAADKRIRAIVEAGLIPVIVGGWGHHLEQLGFKTTKLLWKEILSRFSHYPAIFCLAGEIDLFPPPGYAGVPSPSIIRKLTRLANHFFGQQALKRRLKQWNEIGEYVAKNNHSHQLITAHPQSRQTAGELLGYPQWLTLDAIQSGHSEESLQYMTEIIRRRSGRMPIVNMEPWYEGIHGSFFAWHQRMAFWGCVLSGAKGHAYGAHGIWQVENNDGFMAHWGKSTFEDALQFSGARDIGQAKKFLMTLPWWTLHPTEENFHAVMADNRHLIYVPNWKTFKYDKSSYVSEWRTTETYRKIDHPSQAPTRDVLLILKPIK